VGTSTFKVSTDSKTDLKDITSRVSDAVRDSDCREGICCVYVPHTTAAVTINESADPSVAKDIRDELNKVIPFQDNYSHAEGNSAAHIKGSIVGPSVSIPVEGGSLSLGTWQGVFFCEFDGPRSRKVKVVVK
jgi:secondary thiamine-phosphate synthase enzyme